MLTMFAWRRFAAVALLLALAGCEAVAPSTPVATVQPAASPMPPPSDVATPANPPPGPTASPRPTAAPVAPPPKPTGLRVHEDMEALCDPDDPEALCGVGDSTFTITWEQPRIKGVAIRVYGVKSCFGTDDDGRMIDGWCLREHTTLPSSTRVLLGKAAAPKGRVTFVMAQDEHWLATLGGTEVYAFVIAAYNPDGSHSTFAIAARAEYCMVADVACNNVVGQEDFEPGSWMTTEVNGVRVRSKPTVASGSIKYEPLLSRSTEFSIIRGPVLADGYRWYRIELAPGILDDSVRRGWVAAASRDGDPWITPAGIDEG